jgi:hypothetical protein
MRRAFWGANASYRLAPSCVFKSFYASIHQVFGDQVAVIDRFHVVQQAVGALDGVLRSIKTQLEPEEAKELLIPSDFVVHSFRPPMEAAMSRLWSQLG